jgi:hypothetical protein
MTDRGHNKFKGFPQQYLSGHHGHEWHRAPLSEKLFRSIEFLTENDQKRFWDKVDKTPGQGPKGQCWVWVGSRNKTGYGTLGMTPRYASFLAHRLSWFIAHGSLPNTLLVLHHCDNPPCINPDHLFLGTQKDNMLDCKAKGRVAVNGLFGEDVWKHKLTEKDVLAIRSSYTGAYGQCAELGRKYGVTGSLIVMIIKRKTWKHI